MQTTQNKPVTGSYKGSPTITLNPDSKWPFTFGLAKAKAILENVDAIRDFVLRNDKPKSNGSNEDRPEDYRG